MIRPALNRPLLLRTPLVFFLRPVGLGILVLAAMSGLLMSQQDHGGAASTPVVTFTLDFPQSDPAHYSITVDATGHARFECTAKVA
jgi:hypothetical protein